MAGAAADGVLLPTMTLNVTKAGMEGLDAARINRVIEQASRGSEFYANKARKQRRIDEQVESMLRCRSGLPPSDVEASERRMDDLAASMKAMATEDRTIVHVDMDAFYAAVHERDDPTLKSRPMAVGSNSMLSTSNYAARRFGVRAGMPGFIAVKLCPQLVLVPTDFQKYRSVAATIRSVFAKYDPGFSAASLDEAYLDITDHLEAVAETPSSVVAAIREEIRQVTEGLTASAGVARNALLAKVSSDQRKPNGQFELLDPTDAAAFVRTLPLRKVGGIGNVTEQLLKKVLGVETCGELFEKRGLVGLLFGPATAHFLLRASMGLGPDRLAAPSKRKSLSTETTFSATDDRRKLAELCGSLCRELSESLSREGLKGRSLTVKIKTHQFEVKTRAARIESGATNDAGLIEKAASRALGSLLDEEKMATMKLRLMGVRMAGWDEEGGQTKMEMFLGSRQPRQFCCPVCGNDIRARSESAFNDHLDGCLTEQGEGAVDAGDPVGIGSGNDRKACPSQHLLKSSCSCRRSAGSSCDQCCCRELKDSIPECSPSHRLEECFKKQPPASACVQGVLAPGADVACDGGCAFPSDVAIVMDGDPSNCLCEALCNHKVLQNRTEALCNGDQRGHDKRLSCQVSKDSTKTESEGLPNDYLDERLNGFHECLKEQRVASGREADSSASNQFNEAPNGKTEITASDNLASNRCNDAPDGKTGNTTTSNEDNDDKRENRRKRLFSCPVCRNSVETESESSFNHHLDECLLKQGGRDELETENECPCPVCGHLVKVDDEVAFSVHVDECLEKARLGNAPTPNNRKRKFLDDGNERRRKTPNTILNYFK